MDQPATKVLVVDDEPHVVHIIKYKLEHAGLTVFVANNGRHGFDCACEQLPQLVVTDFQMPGVDGVAMARMLKEDQRTCHIPLIMLTARGHRAPLEELAKTNVRSLLAKPFSPRELLKKVQQLLAEVTTGPDGEAAAA